MIARIKCAAIGVALLLGLPAWAQEPVPLTGEAINAAALADVPPVFMADQPVEPPLPAGGATPPPGATPVVPAPVMAHKRRSAAVVRLQVLLDRAGASPGVIDGFDGENVRKAVLAFEMLQGLPADGVLDPELLARLERPEPVVVSYTITPEDTADIVAPLPTDYAELAQRDYLGFTSVAEALAERFHMDIGLLETLNPGATYAPGEQVLVTDVAGDVIGEVAFIEADKTLRQVRAYDVTGRLLAAYPATIGSEDNPSPSGHHTVTVVVLDPDYTYNPKINFQQGENTRVLTLPPGPNGPVGSVWIGLSQPTYGIHGTPEPSRIDKTGSHGCVRLTNWDARELAGMVKAGVTVDFVF